jgi:hypothetical protein
MPTSTVLTLFDLMKMNMLAKCRSFGSNRKSRCDAYTITEMVVTIVILSFFVILVTMSLSGLLNKSSFDSVSGDFVGTLQDSVTAASHSDRRFEVIIDLVEQYYTFREITSPDLSEVLEEEIISENFFTDDCFVDYVIFDDGEYTEESRVKFRTSKSGFQYGGKIVLRDKQGNLYSVLVNRLSRVVKLVKGDVEILTPKRDDEMFY